MTRFAVLVARCAVVLSMVAGCGSNLPQDNGPGGGWGGVSARSGGSGGSGGSTQGATGGGATGGGFGGGFASTGGGSAGGGGFEGTGGGVPVSACASPDFQPVVVASKTPPPISGGTMAVLSDQTAAIADSDRDQVYLLSPTGNVTTVALAAGDEPGRVVEGPNQTVFVALRGTGQVAQIDVPNHTLSQRMTACSAPRGLAYDDANSTLWVACSSGELARLTLTSSSYKRDVTHPVDDLRDVLLFGSKLLVTTFREAAVYSIGADGSATKFAQPVSTLTPSGRQFTPQVAWRTVATGAGLVMSFQQEETTAVPPSVPCMVSGYGTGGTPTTPGTDTSTVGSNLALLTASSQSDLTGVFPQRGALPVDVAVSPDGSQIAVAYAASKSVVVTLPSVLQTIQFNSEPVSIGWRGQSLVVYLREPAAVETFGFVSNTSPVVQQQLSLSNITVASTGHDLFHLATTNAIACASCHPEAGDDGHVWNLQEGIRRTPSLRGGLAGTEPFHWSGEEPDMDTLMGDIFTLRMGGTFEDADHTKTLVQWLDAQPVRPAPSDLDPAAVSRGAAEFTALACDSCHAGARGTNNTTVDVGTGEAFQVPRLVELAYRAPFLHDGTVPTLADRFSAMGGVSHPGSSGLTAQQVSDLVAYLKTR